MSRLITITKTFLLALIFGLSITYVSAWVGPPSGGAFNCPAGHTGCEGPLHVGGATQSKAGGLNLGGALNVTGAVWGGGLFTNGGGYFGSSVGIYSGSSTLHPGLLVNKTGLVASANQASYDIVAGRYAAQSSIYSYDYICAGNTAGACTGINGVVIRGGSVAPTAATVGISSGVSFFNGGNVGIGTNNPGAKLDVNGNLRTTAFQLPTNAGAGKVLTSDAAGNASWSTNTGVVTGTGAGTIGQPGGSYIQEVRDIGSDWNVVQIAGQFTAGPSGGDAASAGGFIYRTGPTTAYAALYSGQSYSISGGVGTTNLCSTGGSTISSPSLCVRLSGSNLVITTGSEIKVIYMKVQ